MTNEFTNGQLYWDSQDGNNEGWWLSYRDARGNEEGYAIDGDRDASTESLAAAVASKLTDSSLEVKVFRGDEPKGRISIVDGAVENWRAA